ncbi:phosphatidylglycerol lysyltransferase domain-containing protein [Kitasatospora sp. NPDC001175]|uniref:phosphatidylglycerol lysyltransferase domain-containing protein n=1 Tax=Kitasatospora sp. NPDC001175 TaxID=3157103 RepID=UPI003CFDDAE0
MSAAALESVPRTPEAEPDGRRRLRVLGAAVARLRTAPLTVALLVVMWAVGWATGSVGRGPSEWLLGHVGVGLASLNDGHWWALAGSLLWCSGIGAYVATSVILLVIGPAAEQRLGTAVTAAVLLAGQVLGALLGTGAVRLGMGADIGWTLDIQDQLAIGPMTGLVAVAAVLAHRLTVLWRRRLRLVLVLVPLVMMLYVGNLQGVQRMAGVLVGFGLGVLMHRRLPGRAQRVSRTETRVLVALCLVATALGPLVASLYQDAIGPFNTLGDLYFSHATTGRDVVAACQEAAADCARAHAMQRFFGSPGRLMAALVPVLLVVLAEGLRRGLRVAWWITAVTELLWIGVLGRLLALNYDDFRVIDGVADLYELIGEAVLLPVLMLALLLATRRRFDQQLPRRDLRRLAGVIGGALLLSGGAYIGLGWLVRKEYEPTATLGKLAAGLLAELLPPAYGELLPGSPIAAGGTAQTLEIYCGLLFWTVALTSLLLAFRRPVVHADAADAVRARELLTRYGGSTLSYIATWEGNHYWFDRDGTAAVPYRVIATVALTTGDPFGEPEARRRAVAGFARYCDTRGWTPCFYSVTPETAAAAEELGWRSLQVAEDTVVPLPGLAFTGKKWQDVRTSLNKAAKQGITAEWWRYQDAPLAITDQIRSISEEWVCDKGLPEMGFTLGGLAELADPEVRLLIAVDGDRTVHGLTSWMPVYENGETVGWTLDFMRRRAEARGGAAYQPFRGVMEFLIASAALGFKEEGARFLSLSGAPLARANRGEPPTALQRMLDWMGGVLEPVYGFRSLLAFKAKFQPEYRPMYMAYPDPAALASITRAIGKAYLPHLTAAQGVRLMRKLSS